MVACPQRHVFSKTDAADMGEVALCLLPLAAALAGLPAVELEADQPALWRLMRAACLDCLDVSFCLSFALLAFSLFAFATVWHSLLLPRSFLLLLAQWLPWNGRRWCLPLHHCVNLSRPFRRGRSLWWRTQPQGSEEEPLSHCGICPSSTQGGSHGYAVFIDEVTRVVPDLLFVAQHQGPGWQSQSGPMAVMPATWSPRR